MPKTCPRCNESKPRDQFGKDRSRSDGRFPYCKACVTQYMTAWKADPDNRESMRARDRARSKDPARRAYKRAHDKLRHLRAATAGTIEMVSVAELLERDGDACSLCGEPLNGDITLEHNTPISRGGTHTRSNLSLAHNICNCRKGTMTLEEWRRRPIRA